MARFRAIIQGCRGSASRLGSKRSGIDADINGWHGGISVRTWVDANRDMVCVSINGGSGGVGTPKVLYRGELTPYEVGIEEDKEE